MVSMAILRIFMRGSGSPALYSTPAHEAPRAIPQPLGSMVRLFGEGGQGGWDINLSLGSPAYCPRGAGERPKVVSGKPPCYPAPPMSETPTAAAGTPAA